MGIEFMVTTIQIWASSTHQSTLTIRLRTDYNTNRLTPFDIRINLLSELRNPIPCRTEIELRTGTGDNRLLLTLPLLPHIELPPSHTKH